MNQRLLILATMALWIFLPNALRAQGYPKQPINLIVPLAPGDATDVAGRTIGEGLSKLLKVPVVVVNRPGAGGTIGTDSAVKAPKDGYTIVITNNASLVFNRILTPETVPYDPFKDLTPIGMAVPHADHPRGSQRRAVQEFCRDGGIRLRRIQATSASARSVPVRSAISPSRSSTR
jgi:tripartite-type tricarboxylate transporter receptor subunit TctC